MTGDEASGLRERKKRQTRLALSQATIRLCLERGWADVTIEDVAAAADVSVRTFRNYFSGKAEAISATHLERMLRVAGELRARPADEPLWESVGHAVEEQFTPASPRRSAPEEERRWRDSVRLLLAEPALQGEVARANAIAQDALVAAVAERTGTDPARDLHPRLVAAVIGAVCSAVAEHCLRADPPLELGPVLREAFDLVAAGLPGTTALSA